MLHTCTTTACCFNWRLFFSPQTAVARAAAPACPSHHRPQITITLLHLTRNVHSGYLSIACALQCILLLFRWVLPAGTPRGVWACA